MIDSFRSLLGNVTVKETNAEIVVSGIRAKDIIRDMNKFWKTTRISQNIFNTVSNNAFSFYKFFAPEIMYILENIKFYRNRWTSVRSINAIIEQMMENTWLKNTKPVDRNTVPGRLDFRRLANIKFTAKPYQMEYFENYSYRLNQYGLRGDLLAAGAGLGKAQPLDALIKVPGGWKQMGEINKGDIVTAWDGTPTEVTGVFPQGIKQTFTITFKDGRNVEACDEHLWRVYCYAWKRQAENPDGWKIINSKELFAYINMPAYKNRLYIQLCKPEDSKPTNLPIHPYNLGVILGDGCITQGTTTISKPDEELFDNFRINLPDSLILKRRDAITYAIVKKDSDNPLPGPGRGNEYATALIDLGLRGMNSCTKFIPDIYLHGSYQQRLELVQGLMDTDGTVGPGGTLSFSSSSCVMAKQLQYLVRSLGGTATLSLKYPHYTYLGERKEGNTNYVVVIRLPVPSIAFKLTRKKDLCNDDGQYTGDILKLKVTHVNVSDRVECQCISVSHPDHLYVTNDFVVTHNTFSYSAIAEMLAADLIIVFCPKAVLESVWVESVNEMFKTPQTIWHSGEPMEYTGQRWVLCHYDAMHKLNDLFENPRSYADKKIVTILDESHNMNDPNSARTIQYLSLVKMFNSNNNLMGSGTPVKALGSEIITLLRVTDPLFIPAVEAIFKKIYGKEASKGLDIIRHRLGLVSYKIEKSVVEDELLPPIMRPYPVKIPDGARFTLPAIRVMMEAFIKERAAYYKARRDEDLKFWDKCVKLARSQLKDKQATIQFDEYLYKVHLISRTPDPRFLGEQMKEANAFEKHTFEKLLPRDWVPRFRDVKSVIKYVNLKIQGEVLGRVVGGMRIEANVAMIPYINWVGIVESTAKKTIMFTSFVEAVEAAEAHTVKLGMKPLVVYGKTSSDLPNMVKRFDADPTLNPLLATYASLSTGVRLTIADTMILLNSPFRAYILEQAISRIYRLGQDSQTYVYQCVLDTGEVPNISTRSADILEWSQTQVESILGIKSPMVEGDVFVPTMEDLKPEDFDDNKLMYGVLSKAFEQYGIEIDFNEFIPKEPIKSIVPAWMR